MPTFYQIGGVGGRILSEAGFGSAGDWGEGSAFLLLFLRCGFFHPAKVTARRKNAKMPQRIATSQIQADKFMSDVETPSGSGDKPLAATAVGKKTFMAQIISASSRARRTFGFTCRLFSEVADDRLPSWPLHSKQNRQQKTGGRAWD